MDWLRRNWPDLLIGVALVIVIAMIIVTLLSGGSLTSLVRRDIPQPLATEAGTGVATTADGSASDTASPTGGVGSTTAGAGSSSAAANTSADGTGTAQAADYDVFVPGVPGQGETDAADLSGDVSASPTTRVGTAGADAPLPAVSRSGGFRVAAGAIDSRDAARTLAQSYRDGGYEVTVEQKNDLYLLWVGPYRTRADADVAAERIVAGGGDALVYNYDGESADAEAAADIAAETSTGTAEAGTATPNANVANGAAGSEGSSTALASNTGAASVNTAPIGDATPRTPTAGNAATVNTPASTVSGNNTVAEDLAAGAGQGQRYLQVGAFASDESAAPRLAQLEQLGLAVTSSENAGGLLRLFIGPYSEAQLTQTQTRLTAQGIESFPVSQ